MEKLKERRKPKEVHSLMVEQSKELKYLRMEWGEDPRTPRRRG